MSYRTYIDEEQIFGNNDYFKEWEEFIKSQGIEIDEEGCYSGDITDVQGLFETIDKITRNMIKEFHAKVESGEKNWKAEPYKELTDLSDSMWLNDDTPILMFNNQIIQEHYVFLPYQAYLILKDKIEHTDGYTKDGVEWGYWYSYKLKEGLKIHVSGG